MCLWIKLKGRDEREKFTQCKPSGFSSKSLFLFLLNEENASIATPPEWDGSSSYTPLHPPGFPASLLLPIYTPGWRETPQQ